MGGSVLLATRKLALSVVVVMFAFITWQSIATGGFARSQQTPLAAIPLVPTPATQGTATNSLQEKCKDMHYLVQEGDTVESIARRFSISTEAILAANQLPTGTIRTGLELTIPLCDSTPTRTIHPPTLTITPSLGTNTLTPE